MGIVDRITSKTELKLAQIERQLGFGNGTIRKWDTSLPSFDKVVAVADLINVSVDYLAGKETKTRFEHSIGTMSIAKTLNEKIESTAIPYSGNERIDSIVKEILKTDLTDDDLKLIEFILNKYKK